MSMLWIIQESMIGLIAYKIILSCDIHCYSSIFTTTWAQNWTSDPFQIYFFWFGTFLGAKESWYFEPRKRKWLFSSVQIRLVTCQVWQETYVINTTEKFRNIYNTHRYLIHTGWPKKWNLNRDGTLRKLI